MQESKAAKKEITAIQNQPNGSVVFADPQDAHDSHSIASDKSEKKKCKGTAAKLVSKLSPKSARKKVDQTTALLKVDTLFLKYSSVVLKK